MNSYDKTTPESVIQSDLILMVSKTFRASERAARKG